MWHIEHQICFTDGLNLNLVSLIFYIEILLLRCLDWAWYPLAPMWMYLRSIIYSTKRILPIFLILGWHLCVKICRPGPKTIRPFRGGPKKKTFLRSFTILLYSKCGWDLECVSTRRHALVLGVHVWKSKQYILYTKHWNWTNGCLPLNLAWAKIFEP